MEANLEDRARTVDPEEAAERLGISVSTLANWRWRGEGPAYQKIGGRVRYRLQDLAEYLEGCTHTPSSDSAGDVEAP